MSIVAGERWWHREGREYTVLRMGSFKRGPKDWVECVIYTDGDGKWYCRETEDFLRDFSQEAASWEARARRAEAHLDKVMASYEGNGDIIDIVRDIRRAYGKGGHHE